AATPAPAARPRTRARTPGRRSTPARPPPRAVPAPDRARRTGTRAPAPAAALPTTRPRPSAPGARAPSRARGSPRAATARTPRAAMVDGTQCLRLDFYELCARRMAAAGVATTFIRRLGPDTYLAGYVETPPFEVIVKNAAQGSTSRKYPGLFPEGHRFEPPVV